MGGGVRRSRSTGRQRAPELAADHNGVGSSRKQASDPGMLADSSFVVEYRRSKPKEVSGLPMKMLIDEEVSKDMNARHTSPGIIGRLMGLDSLPSFVVHNEHKYTRSHSQETSPESSQGRYGFSEDILHRRSMNEMPKFKDVFEVMEVTRVKTHRSPKSRSGNVSSHIDKVDNVDLDFIRQKFMDRKHLSATESFERLEEFNDALEALVSNRELRLENFQESNPVLTRDLHDHSCSPSSIANQITILKPSRRNKVIDADVICPQDKGTERCFHMRKEVKRSSRKPYANFSKQSLKEGPGSLRQKLSKSSHQESIGKQVCPTRIVVLKPNLENVQSIEGAFLLTREIFHSGYRRHKASRDASFRNSYTEEPLSHMSPEDSETLGRVAKESRETARKITKQMRAARGHRSGKHIIKQDIGTFSDERSHFLPSVTSEPVHRSSELCNAWVPPSFISSPKYSTETSVIKEARKHLSDRWKVTRQYQCRAPDANGFSTLRDMLSLSDPNASKFATQKTVCHKCPKGEMRKDKIWGSCSNPPGIGSNDGWKDVSISNLARSKSLPSSFNWGTQKLSNRKRSGRHSEFSMLKDVLKLGPHDSDVLCRSRQRKSLIRSSTFHSDEADAISPYEWESMVREIHVNYEEPTKGIAMPEASEQKLVHPANTDRELDAECYLDTSSAVSEWKEETTCPASHSQQMQQESGSALYDHFLIPSLDDLASQTGGIKHHQGNDNPALCNPPTESESPVSFSKDGRPSPVSVLESSLDAEDDYPGGFEKISADLQELRLQLRLLKMETVPDADETDVLVLSDDEISTASQPFLEMDISHAFRDEEERDFSYLLDMLIDLGIHAANQDLLLSVCQLLECPSGPGLYDRLEKKYSKLIQWPQSERKLLFDLTNAVLADIVTSLMRCRKFSSKWNQDGFVEEVWQRVVQQRREMCYTQEVLFMDEGWLGSGDGIDLVGSEIESMLHEDLLEDVIAGFLV